MTWIKIDDSLPDHPRVADVIPEAMWLYVAGLCYCNRLKTDGRIPKSQVSRLTTLPKPERLRASLVEVGLWVEHDKHIEVWNYLKFNRSAAEMEAASQRAASAGRSGGLARSQRVAKQPTSKPLSESLASGLAEKRREEKKREEEPKSSRRTQLPPDFKPDDAGVRLCRELSLDLPSQLSKFSDHHKAKGTVMLDWQAAWRTWMHRSKEFGPTGPRPMNGHKPYKNPDQEAYLDTAI